MECLPAARVIKVRSNFPNIVILKLVHEGMSFIYNTPRDDNGELLFTRPRDIHLQLDVYAESIRGSFLCFQAFCYDERMGSCHSVLVLPQHWRSAAFRAYLSL